MRDLEQIAEKVADVQRRARMLGAPNQQIVLGLTEAAARAHGALRSSSGRDAVVSGQAVQAIESCLTMAEDFMDGRTPQRPHVQQAISQALVLPLLAAADEFLAGNGNLNTLESAVEAVRQGARKSVVTSPSKAKEVLAYLQKHHVDACGGWCNMNKAEAGIAEILSEPAIAEAPAEAQASSAIAAKVRSLISAQLEVAPERVTLEATFADDLHADSLAAVELVLAIEEEFAIEIPDEDFEGDKIKTVSDAVRYIEARVR